MNMVDYLKAFLEEKNSEAAIPGLGIFYLDIKNGKKGAILFKEVAPKSKAFVTYIAVKKNITEQEALQIVEVWVKEILKALKSTQVATLPGVGTFEVSSGKVVFLPSSDQLQGDRFGLEAENEKVEAVHEKEENIEAESELKYAPKQTSKPRCKCCVEKKWYWIGGAAVLVVAIVACCFFIEPLNQNISNMFAPDDTSKVEEVVLGQSAATDMTKEEEDAQIEKAFVEGEMQKEQAEEQIVASTPQAKPAQAQAKPTQTQAKPAQAQAQAQAKPAQAKPVNTMPQGAIVPQKGTLYIVVGSYASFENALKSKNELGSNPVYSIKILFDANRNIYRVSLKNFTDREAAMKFRNEVRSQGVDGWIYEQK